jgi:hypothetical protein
MLASAQDCVCEQLTDMAVPDLKAEVKSCGTGHGMVRSSLRAPFIARGGCCLVSFEVLLLREVGQWRVGRALDRGAAQAWGIDPSTASAYVVSPDRAHETAAEGTTSPDRASPPAEAVDAVANGGIFQRSFRLS